MPSLNQLLSDHGALLVLDAASSRLQVGWLQAGTTSRWAASDKEAGIGLFESLESLSVNPAEAPAVAFCEGPGSLLGIRTCAMAIRAWQVLRPCPVYAYGSLSVVAHRLNRPEIAVIADARRDSWHCQRLGQALQRLATSELEGEFYQPAGFRHWSTPPHGVQLTGYDLAEMLPAVAEADLFSLTNAPDAFLHEEPRYKTWTPGIHRAP